jgi:ATP-dependent Clp protease, protease subunit
VADLAGKKILYAGFSGVIDSAGVAKISSAINTAVNEQFDCLYLCFNSIGGYIGEAIFLYNHIRAVPIPLIMHNTGTVASAATTIFVAANHRCCSKNSVFMVHPVQVPASGNMAVEPLQSALDSALKDEARIEGILRDRTIIPDEILFKRRANDIYLAADDALKYGLVHSVEEFTLPAGNKVFHL